MDRRGPGDRRNHSHAALDDAGNGRAGKLLSPEYAGLGVSLPHELISAGSAANGDAPARLADRGNDLLNQRTIWSA
jgi:hypothetical protein